MNVGVAALWSDWVAPRLADRRCLLRTSVPGASPPLAISPYPARSDIRPRIPRTTTRSSDPLV